MFGYGRPARTVARTSSNSFCFEGGTIGGGPPRTSSRVHPKIPSAARFHRITWVAGFPPRMPTGPDSITACSRSSDWRSSSDAGVSGRCGTGRLYAPPPPRRQGAGQRARPGAAAVRRVELGAGARPERHASVAATRCRRSRDPRVRQHTGERRASTDTQERAAEPSLSHLLHGMERAATPLLLLPQVDRLGAHAGLAVAAAARATQQSPQSPLFTHPARRASPPDRRFSASWGDRFTDAVTLAGRYPMPQRRRLPPLTARDGVRSLREVFTGPRRIASQRDDAHPADHAHALRWYEVR